MTSDQAESALELKSRNTLAEGIVWTVAGAHEAIEMISSMSRPLIADMASSAHSAVDQASCVAASATRSLGISDDEFQDVQRKLVEAARNYVQLHPVATLGIAVIVGIAASRLMVRP